MKSRQDPENNPSVATKTGEMSARDIDTCLMCTWPFPHSFRGEEKNTHMNRCMEGLGEEDKKLWSKCMGDLKQYMFGFNEHLAGPASGLNRSTSGKKKDSRRQKSIEPLDDNNPRAKKSKEGKKRGKELNGEDNGETKKDKSDKDKRKKNKNEKDYIGGFEPGLKKKLKNGEGGSEKEAQSQIQIKIIRLPVVTELVFDPSKEFSKRSRKSV